MTRISDGPTKILVLMNILNMQLIKTGLMYQSCQHQANTRIPMRYTKHWLTIFLTTWTMIPALRSQFINMP